MAKKPINWKLYVLAGYLLAQLTPQVRLSIQEKDGWYWPSVKLGYSQEVVELENTKFQVAQCWRHSIIEEGAKEYWRCRFLGNKDCGTNPEDRYVRYSPLTYSATLP